MNSSKNKLNSNKNKLNKKNDFLSQCQTGTNYIYFKRKKN